MDVIIDYFYNLAIANWWLLREILYTFVINLLQIFKNRKENPKDSIQHKHKLANNVVNWIETTSLDL